MYRMMVKYTMSPDAMSKWLDQMPGLMSAIETIQEDVIFEGSWVSKDRTEWFHIRTLESEEANKRFVEQLLASDWGPKYDRLMEEHEHSSWELELDVPRGGAPE
ncbi:MAG: hypothetical protein O3C10_03495 [Chloroflexi bacterium]|nr:hypothetical protein [Chloroflexota bacterium]